MTDEIAGPLLSARCTVVGQRFLLTISPESEGGRQKHGNDYFERSLKRNVMSENKVNRSKRVHVRFTDREFEKIQGQYSRSTCRKLSEYVRLVLLNRPVTMNQRNQSLDDFMIEMIALRNELNAIGNNYNQAVKRLHTLEEMEGIKTWLMTNETARKIIQNKIGEIKEKINQFNDIWLR
jgi:hypothetical protein